MIIKPKTYDCLMKMIRSDYGEWIEQGVSFDSILLSLLHKEKQKNYDLLQKMDYLERRGNS